MAARVLDAQTDLRFAGAASMLNAGVRSLIAPPLLDPKGCARFMVLCSNAPCASSPTTTSSSWSPWRRSRECGSATWHSPRGPPSAAPGVGAEAGAAASRSGCFPHRLPELPGLRALRRQHPVTRGVGRLLRGDRARRRRRVRGDGGRRLRQGAVASLLTGYLEAMASVAIESGLAPHQVFNQISGPLFRRTPPDRYATVLMAAIELGTGQLRWPTRATTRPSSSAAPATASGWNRPALPLGLIEAPSTVPWNSARPGRPAGAVHGRLHGRSSAQYEEFGSDRLAERCAALRASPRVIARGRERDVTPSVGRARRPDDRTLVMVRRKVDGESWPRGPVGNGNPSTRRPEPATERGAARAPSRMGRRSLRQAPRTRIRLRAGLPASLSASP